MRRVSKDWGTKLNCVAKFKSDSLQKVTHFLFKLKGPNQRFVQKDVKTIGTYVQLYMWKESSTLKKQGELKIKTNKGT